MPKRTARARMLAAWARIASGPSVLYEWKHVRLEPHAPPAPASLVWRFLGRRRPVRATGARPVWLAGSPTKGPGLCLLPCGGARPVPRAAAQRGVRSPGA